jgi:hypothetical protein
MQNPFFVPINANFLVRDILKESTLVIGADVMSMI